ncbi:MAG: NADH-quinone oxidoreductase subunit C [Bacteroidales bacterium]
MNPSIDKLLASLTTRFSLSDITEQREDLVFVTVRKEQLVSVLTHLRDTEGFSHFVLLSAVDWIEDNVFQLSYIVNHPQKHTDVVLRVLIDREDAVMESAHHLWKQIATYQRELFEMYGISFPGSPRVDEAFILEGWDDKPPMRRDFDTKKYSEETYFPRPGRETKDPKEHMKNKLYPDADK